MLHHDARNSELISSRWRNRFDRSLRTLLGTISLTRFVRSYCVIGCGRYRSTQRSKVRALEQRFAAQTVVRPHLQRTSKRSRLETALQLFHMEVARVPVIGKYGLAFA